MASPRNNSDKKKSRQDKVGKHLQSTTAEDKNEVNSNNKPKPWPMKWILIVILIYIIIFNLTLLFRK